MDLAYQKILTDRLSAASKQYYHGKSSEFSDVEFDLKLKELQKLEADSGIIFPESPTQRVGCDKQRGFKKGCHPKPMLTIENTYDDDSLQKWVNSMVTKYGANYFNISVKYDGISCELRYTNSMLVQALTRGDKLVGDDVTENVRTISSIPAVLKGDYTCPDNLYVRGEILLPKSKLGAINAEREKQGLSIFANTRNACSGSIKQLDPQVTASRGLIFRPWDCFGGGLKFETMEEKAEYLQNIGFYYEEKTVPYETDASAVVEDVSFFKQRLDGLGLDYEYDGVVIKVDNVSLQEEIGTKDTRAIEWGIARKWNEEYGAKTKLIGVDWQVGRTGIVTPVGRLSPVECNGVVISNVSLFNAKYVRDNDLYVGDQLDIVRSGGVIPYVTAVIHGGDLSGRKVSIPQNCPICGGELMDDGVSLFCKNDDCPAKIQNQIIHFCSKECMDIRGMGPSVIETLLENQIIGSIDDIYAIPSNYNGKTLANRLGDGFGEKSCQALIEAIAQSKSKPFDRTLNGLSIPGIGKVTARILCSVFHDISKMQDASEEDFAEIDGIGKITAADLYAWFHESENTALIERLHNYGLSFSAKEDNMPKEDNKPLDNLTICFTGASSRFSGDNIEDFLESVGAKCTHGVSRKLNYLIIGEKPGLSKVKKAEELGVEIINEDDFFQKFNLKN